MMRGGGLRGAEIADVSLAASWTSIPCMLDFAGREAVVTGGTGALGQAVVGRLLTAGAVVHVPVYLDEELDGFPHRDHEVSGSTAGSICASRRMQLGFLGQWDRSTRAFTLPEDSPWAQSHRPSSRPGSIW